MSPRDNTDPSYPLYYISKYKRTTAQNKLRLYDNTATAKGCSFWVFFPQNLLSITNAITMAPPQSIARESLKFYRKETIETK